VSERTWGCNSPLAHHLHGVADLDVAGGAYGVAYRVSMPLRNRVTPFGTLVPDPARGLVYGNRGCLHDANGEIRRPYGVRRWIACRLEFRGWHRAPLMQPGRFTELFFLDEATAFAAGHRPCRMCRHDDHALFVEAWSAVHPGEPTNADAIDEVLHAERWDSAARRQRHHDAPWRSLPDGAFVERNRAAWLVLDGRLVRWTPAGYTEVRPRPARGEVSVITPPSLVKFLRTEREPLVPFLHPSARP
jgi:hypothetical protein